MMSDFLKVSVLLVYLVQTKMVKICPSLQNVYCICLIHKIADSTPLVSLNSYLKLSWPQSLTYFLKVKPAILLKIFKCNPKGIQAVWLKSKVDPLSLKLCRPFCWLHWKQHLKLLLVYYFFIQSASLDHLFIHSASPSFNQYLLSTYYVAGTVHIETPPIFNLTAAH